MDDLQKIKKMRYLPYIFGAILGISLALVIISGLIFSSVPRSSADLANPASTTPDGRIASMPAASIGESRRNAIVVATENVAPAVVTITTTFTRVYRPFLFDFEQWFGRHYFRPRKRSYSTLGSGVIIDGKGYILTNEHVVSRAEEINVTLSTGETLDGRLVGSAPDYDLALIKVDGKDLPYAPLGDSSDLLVGEWVIAIGSPFGWELSDPQPTVTVGVVSAFHREVRGESSERIYKDMIQTDAAINPGNSGGPLVNSRGEVIGINTFIFSQSGGSIGMGFAIPINRGKWVLDEIVHYGRVRSVWVGISAMSVTPEVAVSLNLKRRRGVLISSIEEDSPASKAGLKPGDLIVAVNGRDVTSVDQANHIIFGSRVGDELVMDIERKGKKQQYTIKLEEHPGDI
ncbi:MAG: trypsin-like serine protease [Candidatus Latescibacteria bacterium]|nr:trypsin-like serine protease [Candidatus Latescibacterota bacterium]NIM22074.1 trypsin-like serine protease [Candidatus Latescibacterota bacterium]NIM66093.1 trypsin-like serine protease [Candidatus Latescibacterota bacterium]NIO02501.1 trypsin-like serine protease [Candidatus Latescibacterota bacterium]NIO29412.1 trypsin-like serine protease [Candidatus Latescibacterota bacterium]